MQRHQLVSRVELDAVITPLLATSSQQDCVRKPTTHYLLPTSNALVNSSVDAGVRIHIRWSQHIRCRLAKRIVCDRATVCVCLHGTLLLFVRPLVVYGASGNSCTRPPPSPPPSERKGRAVQNDYRRLCAVSTIKSTPYVLPTNARQNTVDPSRQ